MYNIYIYGQHPLYCPLLMSCFSFSVKHTKHIFYNHCVHRVGRSEIAPGLLFSSGFIDVTKPTRLGIEIVSLSCFSIGNTNHLLEVLDRGMIFFQIYPQVRGLVHCNWEVSVIQI